jgi:hypothetical protein
LAGLGSCDPKNSTAPASDVRDDGTNGALIMSTITLFITAVFALAGVGLGLTASPMIGAPFLVIALLVAASLKMANTWQKFVVLRAGNLQGVRALGSSSLFLSSTASLR